MRLSSTRSVGGKQGDIIHNDDAIVRVVCVLWYSAYGIYLSYHATDLKSSSQSKNYKNCTFDYGLRAPDRFVNSGFLQFVVLLSITC